MVVAVLSDPLAVLKLRDYGGQMVTVSILDCIKHS